MTQYQGPKTNESLAMTQDQGPETEDLSQTAAAHLKMLDLNSNLVSPKALHSLTHMFKHPLYCDFTSLWLTYPNPFTDFNVSSQINIDNFTVILIFE